MSDLDDLAEAIGAAQSSVFRLEARQHYADDPQWQAYQQGLAWEDNADLQAWVDILTDAGGRGVPMQRVHVVTEPWTPYVRFEVEQHYLHNLAAGEDVRLVHAEQSWPVPDFWLVDDERAWLLQYQDAGTLGMVVSVASRELPALRQWRDEALAASTALAAAA